MKTDLISWPLLSQCAPFLVSVNLNELDLLILDWCDKLRRGSELEAEISERHTNKHHVALAFC